MRRSTLFAMREDNYPHQNTLRGSRLAKATRAVAVLGLSDHLHHLPQQSLELHLAKTVFYDLVDQSAVVRLVWCSETSVFRVLEGKVLGAVLKILILSASIVFVIAATGYDTRVDIHSGIVDAPGIGKVQIGRNKPPVAFEPTTVKPSFFDYARYLFRGGPFFRQSDTQVAGQSNGYGVDIDRNGMRIQPSHRNQNPASTSVDAAHVPSAGSVRAEMARRNAQRETSRAPTRRLGISGSGSGISP